MAGVLLYGGSFDPIHFGHLIVARAVAERLAAGRVVLTPSAKPPHKLDRPMTPVAERLAMCRLAAAGDGLFEVSDWEARQSGPNYTLHTVRHFREQLPADEPLYWLIGMDSLIELPTWYRVGEILRHCTIVTAGRPGFEMPDYRGHAAQLSPEQIAGLREHILPTPLIEISATEIRARVAGGRSIRYLVPEAVAAFISERGLYRNS